MFRSKRKKRSTMQTISERVVPPVEERDVRACLQDMFSKQQQTVWYEITETTTNGYQQEKRALIASTDDSASSLASKLLSYREFATGHALQDPHAAQQLSDQLDTLVAAVSAQLMDAERVLFTKLESTLTDYFLHLQQLCRSYAQQQAVLDAGRAMEADLEQFHSITRRVIVQEKDYLSRLQARRAEELGMWLKETRETVESAIMAAGTLEDSASALHEPQDRLEACSLPELVPGAEDGSLVDGSIADIVEPSVVESSGVGSRVSGTAGAGGARDAGRGRGGGVYRHHKGLHHASPVPEGMLEGSAEDSGLLSAEHEEEGEDDLVDGTISDILSSYMSELTLSSNASSGPYARSAMSIDHVPGKSSGRSASDAHVMDQSPKQS